MDSTYTGLESQGLGTVQIQLSGGRLAIFVAVDDLLNFFPECKGNLKMAVDLFSALETKGDLPDTFALPSLCCIYARTGDLVYCPCGFVCFEKSITEMCLAVRTGLTFLLLISGLDRLMMGYLRLMMI